MSSLRLRLRAPALEDLGALRELSERRHAAFSSAEPGEGELHDELTRKGAAENVRLAVAGDRVTGWAGLWHPEPGSHRVFIGAHGLPGETDALRALLDWAEGRAKELPATRPLRVHTSAGREDEALAGELRARGYELVRYFLTMEIELAEQPPAPAWAEGIAVRTFRSEDARAVYEADMAAFEDHWNSFTVPFEDWCEYFLESSGFDPSLWFLAEEGEELAGFAICFPERRPGVGHIGVLGVRRPWRKRGIATALLLHSFRVLRDRGLARADLDVDAENLTGAVRLYERVGMRVADRRDVYAKDVA